MKSSDPQPISGDIVFQDTSVPAAAGTAPVTLQAGEAIKKLTNSQWSHCGIYFYRKDLGAVVVDGDGANGKLRTWADWKARGAKGKVAIYRLKAKLSEQNVESLWKQATKYDNRPYDFKFAWDNDTIYCSELVWKAYREAMGVETGTVQKYQDYDLTTPAAKLLITRPNSWGSLESVLKRPNEPIVSPQSITLSPLLEIVK